MLSSSQRFFLVWHRRCFAILLCDMLCCFGGSMIVFMTSEDTPVLAQLSLRLLQAFCALSFQMLALLCLLLLRLVPHPVRNISVILIMSWQKAQHCQVLKVSFHQDIKQKISLKFAGDQQCACLGLLTLRW